MRWRYWLPGLLFGRRVDKVLHNIPDAQIRLYGVAIGKLVFGVLRIDWTRPAKEASDGWVSALRRRTTSVGRRQGSLLAQLGSLFGKLSCRDLDAVAMMIQSMQAKVADDEGRDPVADQMLLASRLTMLLDEQQAKEASDG